jgi:4-hydroxybutyryl-CoA dehydratase/vinylacetyl-CoA-Delta-isomerase
LQEVEEMAEATRLMIDVCGGFVADLPSDRDFAHSEIGQLLKKYLKGVNSVPVENRIKLYRLAEKLALESADTILDIHGGGSPEAHRVTIFRESDVESKKKAAKRLAGIED